MTAREVLIINHQEVSAMLYNLHGPLQRLNGLLTGRINEIFKAQCCLMVAHQICLKLQERRIS